MLAKKLAAYAGKNAVVFALPRGGVVAGERVARALRLPLDIVVVRKVGHPVDPEYALCAVDAVGTLLCNEEERQAVDPAWLAGEIAREREEAGRRLVLYRGDRKPIAVEGKAAIIVDDGIATGLSVRLAIMAVRAQKPRRIVIAVPVAPRDIVPELTREADEFIVLEPPERFLGAVGAHYERFEQVDDATVIRLLSA